MKIVFLGTPDFAVPSLQALINSNHQVVGVVTQPDKPVGRHGKLEFPPVKKLALKHNIPVFQFEKIRLNGVEPLKKLNADIFVTCAYGQILSQEVLDIAPHGVLNVHGSLLPKYRGASPIQWAIINGETETGITILKTQIGMDDGPTILKKSVSINKNETAGELFLRLAPLGAECLLEALTQIENNTATFTPQNESEVILCKMFKKDQFKADFNMPAKQLASLINGLNPWPTISVSINGVKFKLLRASSLTNQEIQNLNVNLSDFNVGEVVVAKPKVGLVIKSCDGLINIIELQPENGKAMLSKSYLNGKHIEVKSKVLSE